MLCVVWFHSGNSCKTQMVDFCIFSNMDVCWALIAYVNGNCNASLTLCVGKYRGTFRISPSRRLSAKRDAGVQFGWSSAADSAAVSAAVSAA